MQNSFISSDGAIQLTQTGPDTATLVENGQTLSLAKAVSNGKDYCRCYVEEFGMDAAELEFWIVDQGDKIVLNVSHAWMDNGLTSYNGTAKDVENIEHFLSTSGFPNTPSTPPVPS